MGRGKVVLRDKFVRSETMSPVGSDVIFLPERVKDKRKKGWMQGAMRFLRYRLAIPIMRGVHTPEHTARGVMIGIFWSMTPFFGIQMMLVLASWLIARKIFKWDFSLVNGLAWTWLTNAFTIIPCFYLFYLTGQLMLGRMGQVADYASFGNNIERAINNQSGFWQNIQDWVVSLASDFGLPILLGSIPWSLLSALVAYRLTLVFLGRYKARRLERRNGA